MGVRRLDWSRLGWPRVYMWTIVGMLACTAIVVAIDFGNIADLEGPPRTRALLMDTLLPVLLTGPALFLLLRKIRELAILQHKLTIYAATDSLTALLNRGAFTSLVEGYLQRTESKVEATRGALLVVDVDHFKQINDRFGHDRGDEALRLIAQSIRNVVREPDIVGRIGGEEFGVFLPGANESQAEGAAERIRVAISSAEFYPDEHRRALTVSVGGVTFAGRAGFTELFRAADKRLYAAKEQGRNRISVAPAPGYAAAA